MLNRKLKIIQGEDRLIKVTLFKDNCEPYDLTSATEITFMFPSADGNGIIKTLTASEVSIVNAVGGKIQTTLDDTDTNALRKAKNQDFKIKIDVGLETRIVKFDDCLTVEGC